MFTSDEEDSDFDEEISRVQITMSNLQEDSRLVGSPRSPPTIVSPRIMNLGTQMTGESESSDDNTLFTAPCGRGIGNGTMQQQHQNSTRYVWILSSFAAIGGFLFGYDTGVVSGAMLLLKDEFSLSSFWQEMIVSVTIAGAFVSSLCGGILNDRFGRRAVTILASLVFTGGAVVLGAAVNVTMLVIGRLILGFGIGFASMTVPMYIAECAPHHLRGRLVTVNNLFITGGQCVASVMDGGFSYIKQDGWRYMLGLAGVPSLIQLFGFMFLPESPRWLLSKGREFEARAVLARLRGTQAVDMELKDIKQSLDQERQSSTEGEWTLVRIMKTPTVRRAVVVGCGLQFFQQLSGINTVMYYSATVIKMSGVSDQHTAIWLAAVAAGVNFVFTLLGVWLVERIGRRKLILSSLAGVILSLVVLAMAFQLASINAPPVLNVDPDHTNNTCSQYRWCEDCIGNSRCGYCYLGASNGTCVAAQSGETSRAEYGDCEDEHPMHGAMWAYDYCPTDYSVMAVLGLFLYLMCFAPGMGPMPWTINSELYPLWARSTGNSLSAATNWLANLAVSLSFLSLTEVITKQGTYWFYAVLAVLGLLFLARCLPETKGRRLEEVQNLFAQPWCSCGTDAPLYSPLQDQTEVTTHTRGHDPRP